MLEEEIQFDCPYCLAGMTVTVDVTEGRRQRFIYDCGICCRPIHLEVRLDPEGLIESFQAHSENETG